MAEPVPQVVRDLLWVVNSPAFCEGPAVEPSASLQIDQIDQEDLLRFMRDRSERRVGRHFEHLVHYWLSEIRRVEMIGTGIQLREGKRTVGEIDFLYRDEEGRLTHCEATVKFFLHLPRIGASDFPGPNATDDYERKTNRLFDHQLEVSRVHDSGIERRRAFVKGMAFYRDDLAQSVARPPYMPMEHGRGRWIRESELDGLGAGDMSGGVICSKPHWLAPAVHLNALGPDQLQSAVQEHFTVGKAHPIMLTLFKGNALSPTAEILFVVPDRWPG